MPLIIVTGLPSSGKSLLADKIHKFIKQRLEKDGISRQVRIVSDSENLDWDGRNSIYMSIPKEKELRAWLRSESQRYVNLNQIVILDAATYIKGFRYELYCMSKEAKTQYCIVELLLEPEICWKQNQERNLPESAYNMETFDALVMRYEKCDENNRWDSPLFRLCSREEELNMEELYSILGENVLVPNKCTSLASTTTSIFKPR